MESQINFVLYLVGKCAVHKNIIYKIQLTLNYRIIKSLNYNRTLNQDHSTSGNHDCH